MYNHQQDQSPEVTFDFDSCQQVFNIQRDELNNNVVISAEVIIKGIISHSGIPIEEPTNVINMTVTLGGEFDIGIELKNFNLDIPESGDSLIIESVDFPNNPLIAGLICESGENNYDLYFNVFINAMPTYCYVGKINFDIVNVNVISLVIKDEIAIVCLEHFNPLCMKAFLSIGEDKNNLIPIDIKYIGKASEDIPLEYWYRYLGNVNLSIENICGYDKTLSIIIVYNEDINGSLVCNPWKEKEFKSEEIIEGNCLSPEYGDEGLYKLNELDNRQYNCSAIHTHKSAYIISSSSVYISGKHHANLSMITPNGAIITVFEIQDTNTGDHYDIDLVALQVPEDNDDFVAVWSSGTTAARKIFAQRFHPVLNSIQPIGMPILISGNDAVSVAPRISFNKETNKIAIIWVSVTNKKIWLKLFTPILNDASAPSEFIGQFINQYFSSSLYMHDDNNQTGYALDIVIISGDQDEYSKDKFFIALKSTDTLIKMFLLQSVRESSILNLLDIKPFNTFFDFEDNKIAHFDMEYDAKKNKLMFVYGKYTDDDIYGVEIPIFSHNLQKATPRKLNIEAYDSYRPRISRSPKYHLGNGEYEYRYLVAWESQLYGIYYNIFSDLFIPQGAEDEIQHDDNDTDKAQPIITDNKIVIIMEARKFNGSAVQGTRSILFSIKNRIIP
ncbi:hypothetical protein V5049_07100 [Moellerella wisconsensis]|uniref:hypothetical protein n=1 Tax=Moellerella wisconsensis TaxID=158849 RepID=UPI0030763BF5